MGIYDTKPASNHPYRAKVLFQGLDGSGKTTIVHYLAHGEVVESMPSIGTNFEKVTNKQLEMHVWDVATRGRMRVIYRSYYLNTQAVMFVIDSSDRERLNRVAEDLKYLLQEPELSTVPVLVLANKQDLDSAMSVDEVKEGIGFEKLTRDFAHRKLKMFGCSAVTPEGQIDLRKAFDWLAEQVAPSSSSTRLWSSSKGNTSDKKEDSSLDGSANDNTDNVSAPSKENVWTFSSLVKETALGLKRGLCLLW